jgi:FixJ family two-component response regulator
MDGAGRVAHCPAMRSRERMSATEHPLVSVIDDDESVRESLPGLLREFGFDSRAFSSAREFLSSDYLDATRCLILDVVMPGMTGLDLQLELKRRAHEIPIIFVTGQKDDGVRKQAFKQGAVQFLYKPFSDTAVLDAINAALRIK